MLTFFLMVIIKIFSVNDEHDIGTVTLDNALDPMENRAANPMLVRIETFLEAGICRNVYGLSIYYVYNYPDDCWVLDCYVTTSMTYMCSTVISWICGREEFWSVQVISMITVFIYLL